MKMKLLGILVCTLLIAAGTIAVADWEVGDGHIMHHPQLPDPYGLDVDFHDWWLADDWYTGFAHEVNDIHFWYSWRDDVVQDIPWIRVGIWSNDPGPPSKPLEELWYREFTDDEFIIAGPFGGGLQGWYHPPDVYIPDEHEDYYQINIKHISDPFVQQAGEMYWLVIQMPYYPSPGIGWKTTLDHYEDNAVYGTPTTGWEPLWDPRNPGEEIHFAFVITGDEPRPRLACEGAIEWLDVKPDDYVHETFGVANNGDTGSLLNWYVKSWPSWGTDWTFTPSSGTNLLAGDSITVNVSVKAPNQPNQPFSGQIEVCNSDDPTDCCTIPVTLTTPKNKPFNIFPPFLRFIEKYPHMFPILRQLLGL
jgi:hypothetical protein